MIQSIQAIGSLAFTGTAIAAWLSFQNDRNRQISDRFAKAVEMLSSEKMEVRLGALYALERIALDSKEDHPVIFELITSYIRLKSPYEYEEVSLDETYECRDLQHDVQVALTIIGRRNIAFDKDSMDLSYTNLEAANLVHADLGAVNLQGCALRFAILTDANLKKANLYDCDLRQARLWRTDLRGANVQNVQLSGTDLWGARLKGASVKDHSLSTALLTGTELPEHSELDPNRDQEARGTIVLMHGPGSSCLGVKQE